MHFPEVIILSNLITVSFDNVLTLLGENWCWSLLGLEGFISSAWTFRLSFTSNMGLDAKCQAARLRFVFTGIVFESFSTVLTFPFLFETVFLYWVSFNLKVSLPSPEVNTWGRQSCHVWLVRAGNFAARVTEQKKGATINSCLVLRPHYSARPMRLGSRGPAVRLRYVTEIDREGLRRRRTATG